MKLKTLKAWKAAVHKALAAAGWPEQHVTDFMCHARSIRKRGILDVQATFSRLHEDAERMGLPVARDLWARLWAMANVVRRAGL